MIRTPRDVKVFVSTLRPRQNGRHFPDDFFKWIFLNENVWISIKISLNFVPKVPINNIPALVQIMAWRRSGDKPLSEPMVDSLLTHICVTRPQWVKPVSAFHNIRSRMIFLTHINLNCAQRANGAVNYQLNVAQTTVNVFIQNLFPDTVLTCPWSMP